MEKKGRKEQNDSRKNIILVVMSIVILLLICLVVFLIVQKQESKPKDSASGDFRIIQTTQPSKPMIVDENNADDIMESLQKDSVDTMFNCRMSYQWTFDNGSAESKNAYVANTDYNHYPIYFEVLLDDTQEIVYTSSIIPVGSEVNGLTLDKDLAAGNYPATVNYHLINNDNQEVSSVGFSITIQVLH